MRVEIDKALFCSNRLGFIHCSPYELCSFSEVRIFCLDWVTVMEGLWGAEFIFKSFFAVA